jgi:transcription antitermination factor NusB
MPSDRRQARILAMQALCQWDVQRDESHAALLDFLTETADTQRDLDGQPPSGKESGSERKPRGGAIEYAATLVTAFWMARSEIDERIGAAADKWDITRISTVERNTMRVAVAEMLGGDVPPHVAIDEGIEIGREYGGADSPRFINGVLDKVLKGLPAAIQDSR